MCWLIVTMTALSLQLLSDILDINYTECLKLQLCIFTKKGSTNTRANVNVPAGQLRV